MPDDALFAAAAAGELHSDDGITTQVDRMLADTTKSAPAIERFVREWSHYDGVPAYDKDATGPKFLENLLTGREGVRYFEPPVFYPRTADELDEAYATHHRARGWKDEEGLRRSLAKAEKRLLEAQREASEWRRKYEELAKEHGHQSG
jgi:hypothetical protein